MTASVVLPFLCNVIDSNANVEKVVKPPHNPVLSNRTKWGFIDFFKAIVLIKPIKNAPRILINRVSNGNPWVVFKGINPIK